ncbi:MAG TPA: hypothetical protein VGG71_10445, partial [Chitinophagaceae bacterium]
RGARCYVAAREKLDIQKWMNSFSTNVKAASGGIHGRPLQKDDMICFKEKNEYKCFLKEDDFKILHWKADIAWNEIQIERLAIIRGNEWDWLTDESKKKFLYEPFIIDSLADRMGYRLQNKLESHKTGEIVSTAVSFGTIQLLPNGEMIILMADHQTTGGYPRVAHIISTHLPLLAQKQPGERIYFRLIDQSKAEELLFKQQHHLVQLQDACKLKLEEFLNAHH